MGVTPPEPAGLQRISDPAAAQVLPGAGPERRAFIWDDGELLVLGPVPGGFSSGAGSINERGVIAGGGLVPPKEDPNGAAFVSDGRIEPGGALPVNTGGGQLSGYYMWGMTPVSEAIIQTRGQGGERQVPKNDAVLVSTQGGILDHHATLILSPNASNQ